MLRIAALILALSAAPLAGSPALAGPFDGRLLPPAPVGDAGGSVTLAQSDGSMAGLVARLQRLEEQNRRLTGQVEEMQNQLRRATDDFNRYREDTEFRLQAVEGGGKPAAAKPGRRSDAGLPPGQQQAAVAPRASGGLGAPPQDLGTLQEDPGQARGDDSLPPPDDQQSAGDPNTPMALPRGDAPEPPRSSLAPSGLPGVAVNTATPPPVSPQAGAPATPESEYTANYRLFESGKYELAEAGFRKFVATYPKDRRVSDAYHWIGETLLQRKQYNDAAEQFLKVVTDYSSSRRAPSSMYKLGVSLAAMGEKKAACDTFRAVDSKYPNAPPTVKNGVTRETQRNGC